METIDKQQELLQLVEQGCKYILVEAPAGTGKTYSCIQNVKKMCELNRFLPHQRALVLTFSRNARAQIMKELSSSDFSFDIAKHIEINNYHSFFKNYIDAYGNMLGISSKITIVDDEDYIECLKDYAAKRNKKINPDFKCAYIDDVTIEHNMVNIVNEKSKCKKIPQPSLLYAVETSLEFTKDTGIVCFAMFGKLIYDIIKKSECLVKAISHDYPVIILDEYQDTNHYQEKFIKRLLKYSSGIFFADKWQMIYDFRGSQLSRLTNLSVYYPSLATLEFSECYRYKEKPDIIQILTGIRNGEKTDYSKLVNGKPIKLSIPCDANWSVKKEGASKSAQCTITAKWIYNNTKYEINNLLKNKKSVAILCHSNNITKRISDIFLDNHYYPRSLSEGNELMFLNKHIKKCLSSTNISGKVGSILAVIACVFIDSKIDNIAIDELLTIDANKFKRKRKAVLQEIYKIIYPYLHSSEKADLVNVVLTAIEWLKCDAKYKLNFARIRFIESCLRSNILSDEDIDAIMLQRQYIDSFTNIRHGLYITTIHQSKGKEFDCVFVFDANGVAEKDNKLLYVSHSRMKERLYPIVINYTGVKY